MPETLKLNATTTDVRVAIEWHAAQIDALIASPTLEGRVEHHMKEITALNRLVPADEDAVHLRVADVQDRIRALEQKFEAERATEREQAKQRVEVMVPLVKAAMG